MKSLILSDEMPCLQVATDMAILRNWFHPWISIKQRYMEAAIFEISFKENEEEAMTMTRRSHEYRCCKVIVDEDGWNKVKDQ